MERASRVCDLQSLKKGPRQDLPRCGYFTQRQLFCVYEDASDSHRIPAVSGGSSTPNLFLHSKPLHTQISLDCALDMEMW